MWGKSIAFFLEFHRAIEIFSFGFWPIDVVFGVHYLKISLKLFLLLLSSKPMRRIWIHWLSSLPVVFYFLVVKAIFFDTIGRCFNKVFVLISVLTLSRLFIKKLFKMRMITMVVFWISNLRSVVPSCYMAASRKVNAINWKKWTLVKQNG